MQNEAFSFFLYCITREKRRVAIIILEKLHFVLFFHPSEYGKWVKFSKDISLPVLQFSYNFLIITFWGLVTYEDLTYQIKPEELIYQNWC